MSSVKRSRTIFVSELECIQKLLPAIQEKLNSYTEPEHYTVTIKLDNSPTIPKKWHGFEFPLDTNILSVLDFKRVYVDFQSDFNDYLDDLCERLYVDATGSVLYLRVALVKKCRRANCAGVLFFWEV